MNWPLFLYLLAGTVLLLAWRLVGERGLSLFVVVFSLVLLVRARRRWPPDHDYYLNRNYTRSRR